MLHLLVIGLYAASSCAKQLAGLSLSNPSYGDENKKRLGSNVDNFWCGYNSSGTGHMIMETAFSLMLV